MVGVGVPRSFRLALAEAYRRVDAREPRVGAQRVVRATRLARYCARNPVALERLTYDRAAKVVTYRSDKSEGPTAGTETAASDTIPASKALEIIVK